MSIKWCISVSLVFLLTLTLTDANAYPPSEDAAPTNHVKRPKELTLEHLYHSDQRFDFDGSLPSTHWIGEQDSKLLVRRGDQWNEMLLAKSGAETTGTETTGTETTGTESTGTETTGAAITGTEQPWPTFAKLCEHVNAMQNIDPTAAIRSVARAVSQMKEESDTILVRIGDALAVVSSQVDARLLTRDASDWKNPTVDPTGRRIGYTVDGDLYVVDLQSNLTRRLTDDATETLLDGVLDWTYQEEIFGRGKFGAFWFSPDGDWLAMLRIDIRNVQPYVLGSSKGERGGGTRIRYSKAGDPIPHASLHLWDLRRFNSDAPPPPRLLEQSTPESEKIISGVWWHPHDASLVYCVSDRKQSYRTLQKVRADRLADPTAKPKLLLHETSPAWVEPPSTPGWLNDGSMLWRSELPSGVFQLYQIDNDGGSVQLATQAGFNVREFKVIPDSQQLFLTGDDAGLVDQHLYQCSLPTNRTVSEGLVSETVQPGWHSTKVSPDGLWYVDRFSNPSTPTALLVSKTTAQPGPSSHLKDQPNVSGNAADPKQNSEFVVASPQLRTMKPIQLPQMVSIKTEDGTDLPAILIRPQIQPETKCPVVIDVYGGPLAPIVTSRWAGTRTLYRELLARRGIATLVLDNRSSAAKSMASTWNIRGRVGEVEFGDLMSAVRWLKRQPWVDADRLAIRGWSFGGFMTLYAMTHTDAFAAGIAGGSVSDWKEYDSFYTERYMGLPLANATGYESSSPINAAAKLSGRLLLIHGEVDNNVHPSNTLRMAGELQRFGKTFQMMIYPGAGHAVTDRKQNWHLHQLTDQFLMDALIDEPALE